MKRVCSYAPALLLVVTLMFTGCAMKPNPYHDDPKNSYALNIMRARGAKDIKDSKPDSVGNQGPSVLGMAAAGWAGAGSSSPASLGLGSLAGAGLNVLAFAIPEKTLESSGLCFGWVKKGGESKEAIIPRIKGQLAHAFSKAVEQTPLPAGYSYQMDSSRLAGVKITGPECGENVYCGYDMNVIDNLIDDFTPETLGGGEGWRFTIVMKPASYRPESSFAASKALFNDLQFFQKLSERLPPEVFIYLAPSYGSWQVSMQTEQGMRFLKMPVLLNKGELHQFVAPSN